MMTAQAHEAVSVVLAAKKIEKMLLEWVDKLTDDERYQVRNHLAGRSDQEALDIWSDAMDVVEGRRLGRGRS